METNETVSLKKIFVKFLRRWRLYLLVFVLSFIPAILYLVIIPRTYEFAAAVQITSEDDSGMAASFGDAAGLMKSFGIGGGGGGSINIDDEKTIFVSNRLLRQIVLDLGLNVSCSRPFSLYQMYDDAPLRLLADSSTMADLNFSFELTVKVSPDKIRVKGKDVNETFTSLPADLTVRGKRFTLDFTQSYEPDKSFKVKIACEQPSWTAESLSDAIIVDDVSKSSNVITFVYTDHNRQRGKDILNTLVNYYNNDTENYSNRKDVQILSFVNHRLTEVVSDLNAVELDIQAFKSKNDITQIEADVAMYGEAMQSLQASIIDLETQGRMIDMLDEFVKDPANRYSVVPPLLSAAQGEKGGSISDYNEALMQRDRIELLLNATTTALNDTLFGKEYSQFVHRRRMSELQPQLKDAESRVEKMREGVILMIENSKKSYDRTLSGLKVKEQELLAKRRKAPAQEHDYINYRRNQEILQGIYLMLIQKKEEAEMSLVRQKEQARFIEPAFVKRKPVAPRKIYALIAILALTMVIPTAIILAKELYISVRDEYRRTD